MLSFMHLYCQEETGSDFTVTFRSFSSFVRLLAMKINSEEANDRIVKFVDDFIKKALAPYQEILESLQVLILARLYRNKDFWCSSWT